MFKQAILKPRLAGKKLKGYWKDANYLNFVSIGCHMVRTDGQASGRAYIRSRDYQDFSN